MSQFRKFMMMKLDLVRGQFSYMCEQKTKVIQYFAIYTLVNNNTNNNNDNNNNDNYSLKWR